MRNPYPAYQPTGLPWLPTIPAHWELRRAKYLLKEINERSISGNEDLLSVSQYTGVTLKKDSLESENDLLTNATTLEGYKKVSANDLVINIMLAWNGSLGVSPYEGITSPAYSVYRFNDSICPHYFHYLFRTDMYKSYFRTVSSGVIESRLRMYSDDFFSIYALLPPREEQEAIARFLDKKTAAIGRFIAAKEKMRALLLQQQQAIINEQLKDEAGQWEKRKLKYLLYEKNERSVTGKEELLSLSKYKGVIYKRLLDERSGGAESLIGYKKVAIDDLVVNKMQACNGLIGVSKIEGITSPDYTICRSKSDDVFIDFYGYLLVQEEYLTEYRRASTGVMEGYIRLYTNELFDIKVPVPPLDKQQAIVQTIKKETATLNGILEKIDQELTLVKAYRESLIAEAVSGQWKVADR
jgi:type I restriction enzyme S subunit